MRSNLLVASATFARARAKSRLAIRSTFPLQRFPEKCQRGARPGSCNGRSEFTRFQFHARARSHNEVEQGFFAFDIAIGRASRQPHRLGDVGHLGAFVPFAQENHGGRPSSIHPIASVMSAIWVRLYPLLRKTTVAAPVPSIVYCLFSAHVNRRRRKLHWREVKWPLPDDSTQRFTDLPVNRYITIIEGESKWS
jgi:hypothetical protein